MVNIFNEEEFNALIEEFNYLTKDLQNRKSVALLSFKGKVREFKTCYHRLGLPFDVHGQLVYNNLGSLYDFSKCGNAILNYLCDMSVDVSRSIEHNKLEMLANSTRPGNYPKHELFLENVSSIHDLISTVDLSKIIGSMDEHIPKIEEATQTDS